VTAVAIWRALQSEQDQIDRCFSKFDIDRSGKLSREELRTMLQQLNDALPVTWTEVDWLIESADTDGDGSLDRNELRAGVAHWYVHVSTRIIAPVTGWRVVLTWTLSACVGLLCTLLVASIASIWSAEDTHSWLSTTFLSLIWKLLIFDPIKTLCCGSLLEPLYALLCGEFETDALLDSVEDVVETYTEEFTGAQVASAQEDINDAARAATVAAGNNAIFAMGGIGAGKFQRQVAMNRVKKGIRIEMEQHEQDNQVLDKRLGLQHTLSSSLYTDKIYAKRRAAGLVEDLGAFSKRSRQSVISAHRTQMQRVNDSEHVQVAAGMVESARRERKSIDQELSEKAAKSRRRYAGVVASKRRSRNLSIGGFARTSGVHVDPLIDILAVSKFVQLRSKASPLVNVTDNVELTSEVRDAEAPMAFGDVASVRHVKLPAAILEATSAGNALQRPWRAQANAIVPPGLLQHRQNAGCATASASGVLKMIGNDVARRDRATNGSQRPLPVPPCFARPPSSAMPSALVSPSLARPLADIVDEFVAQEHGSRESDTEALGNGGDSGLGPLMGQELWDEVEK
jgi:hypothetical protein